MVDEVQFIHTVFFWCKPGMTAQQHREFEQGLEKLGSCPTILRYHYGVPAKTPREVVDNSYDYAWIVHFRNAQDQDSYQDDPIHHEFVKLYKDLWKRVQVYDTVLKN